MGLSKMQTTSTRTEGPRPTLLVPSQTYAVTVAGNAVACLDAGKADFASWEMAQPGEVVIRVDGGAIGAAISPLSRNIRPVVNGETLTFPITEPGHFCVVLPNRKPLFLYIDAPDENLPEPGGRQVRYFGGGRIHDAGQIDLFSGDTLYIERGSVVRGNVVCRDAAGVRICGGGILDGSYHDNVSGEFVRSIVFENCRDVAVEGIIMVHPTTWMLVLARCEHVVVRGLKQIGSCMSSDGIDICGSREVLVERCCLRNDDDNIAVKSLLTPDGHDWRGDVADVIVRDCTFLNGQPGNVMEIGYELSADRVGEVLFEDIDVIQANGDGAVFSIHNGDRAVVENITWRDIRVEHYWDKLVDLRIVHSRYNRDESRGYIRNIRLEKIQVKGSIYNVGCSISLIGGFSADHEVSGVRFEDVFLNGKKVTDGDAIDLHLRHATGLAFS